MYSGFIYWAAMPSITTGTPLSTTTVAPTTTTYYTPSEYTVKIKTEGQDYRININYQASLGITSIDWGDNTPYTSSVGHVYANPGIYILQIKGTFTKQPAYDSRFTGIIIEVLTVRGITDMSDMFRDAINFNQDISGWVTSNVTDMSGMFANARKFNQDISGWSTSNVTNMKYMFANAKDFNQPIGRWDTSKVKDMQQMFDSATKFNQNLNSWVLTSLVELGSIFSLMPSYQSNPTNYTTIVNKANALGQSVE